SYHTALRAVLREDPDIIQIGEIRDFESVSIALSAAETGHLVFSTLHTEGAAKTVDRLVDMFPAAQQRQALGQISTSLKCVVSQRLLPRSDIPGRIGAFEIMFVNSAISNLIRENKIAMIEQVIETSKGSGMITRNKSIEMLLNRGYINQQTAREYSFDVSESDQQMNGGMPGAKPPYGAAAMNRR
ncbi:MAG: Flp pilus assembly complex ATPase component TadA, partial [Clostridia bacterium]|nr:Flp pilus assembly complex ATPase component TadA [Clostridia bacterium]